MRRTIRTAVEQYGHQKFVLVIEESTDPPAVQFKAVDATAAVQLICAQQNGRARAKEPNSFLTGRAGHLPAQHARLRALHPGPP